MWRWSLHEGIIMRQDWISIQQINLTNGLTIYVLPLVVVEPPTENNVSKSGGASGKIAVLILLLLISIRKKYIITQYL